MARTPSITPVAPPTSESTSDSLRSDLLARGAKSSAKADLAATFQHGDHHGVGDADATDQKHDCTDTEQEPGEGLVAGGTRSKSIRRSGHTHITRSRGIGGLGKHVTNSGNTIVGRARVDGRGVTIKFEELFGYRPANQGPSVEFGGEYHRIQNSHHGVLLAA